MSLGQTESDELDNEENIDHNVPEDEMNHEEGEDEEEEEEVDMEGEFQDDE
jgi:hypothetical protein